MKIVINKCYGGFGLSVAAEELYKAKSGKDKFYDFELERDDPNLVAVVEELGNAANDRAADLKVVDVPDGVHWEIKEYDGLEHIAEIHRTWG
jgi:MinD superfamily P-loop ATPase